MSLHCGLGQFDAADEHGAEFSEHDLACNELVLSEDDPHHIGAQSTSGERGDKHIRVEEYPHDTVRTMSSSVR